MISALFCVVTLLVASPCLDTDMVPGISLVQPVEEVVIQRSVAQPKMILARRARTKADDLAEEKIP